MTVDAIVLLVHVPGHDGAAARVLGVRCYPSEQGWLTSWCVPLLLVDVADAAASNDRVWRCADKEVSW